MVTIITEKQKQLMLVQPCKSERGIKVKKSQKKSKKKKKKKKCNREKNSKY